MPTGTHTHAHIHTHMTNGLGKRTRTSPYPRTPLGTDSPYQSPTQTPRVTTRPTNSTPHILHRQASVLPQLLFPPGQSTGPLLSLSHSSTSLRFSLASTHSRLHPRSSSHSSASLRLPSHPRAADSISVLSHTRARNRVPAKRRRAPPNGRNSRTKIWGDASALGPRANKLVPFPSEFSELPQEATEWESASPGYLKSCRSRFYSVSSGTQPSLLAPLVRRRCPTVKRGRVPSLITLTPLPSAGMCPIVKRGWAPQPATSRPVKNVPNCKT
jgi:hypothetical protein